MKESQIQLIVLIKVFMNEHIEGDIIYNTESHKKVNTKLRTNRDSHKGGQQ